MPASLEQISDNTPMGANLTASGATFRVWAPHAHRVHACVNGAAADENNLLTANEAGHWCGFLPGVQDRDRYKFFVVGDGASGPKRDPFARELATPFPGDCVVRASDFPWHETGFVTPQFHDFVIYQLHVGVFSTPNLPRKAGTFLDVADRIPHLTSLGVTAVQLLPIQEFSTQFSLGYNGVDYFSPEMDYAVEDADLPPYLAGVNQLLTAKGLAPYAIGDLRGEMNQLKALIDLCHVHGLAVLLDVVYNHAGGDFGDESIYFFDRQSTAGGNGNSLYFTDRGHAGGLVFDYGKPEVRDFLIQNARFFIEEYRVDGFRYDQVSVIDHDGAPHGWSFCQDLTATVRFARPQSLGKAEYWNVNPLVVQPPPQGAGFDTSLTDGLRVAIRDVIGNASAPDTRPLNMSGLAQSLWPDGFFEQWRFVQGPENHDIVYEGREQRVARLGDPTDPRSWFGRSRARVATGLSLTAPGIPMLFMGQEFLEDKQWSDNFTFHQDLLLNWAGLDAGDKQMIDHVRFTSELIALRWRFSGLRGQGFRVVHVHDENRVLAFHRWVEGEGHDVLIIAHLSTFNRFGYRVGVPGSGVWREVFNSDVYESWVNPNVIGNGGAVSETGRPCTDSGSRHRLSCPPIRSSFSRARNLVRRGEFPCCEKTKGCNCDMTTSGSSFDKVSICSGHMIDAPGRETPRFPGEKAEAVRARIAQQLAQWEIGENDLAICGGACGADTLFAEECLRRGARLRLLLAQEGDDFVRDSVSHAGEEWVRRFHALCEKAEVEILPQEPNAPPNDVSIYARTNLWIIDTARAEAVDPTRIYALLVWDEKPTGDGPGGTSDFQQKVCHLGGQVAIINPIKLS